MKLKKVVLDWLGLTEFDIFSPSIIYPFSILFFLLMGVNGLTSVSLLLFLLFLFSFIFGASLVKRGEHKSYKKIWEFGLPLVILGFIGLAINLYLANGIPLLKPELRSKFFSSLTYTSFLIVPGTIILFGKNIIQKRKKVAFLWFLTGLFLISLTGYRTEIFALILGSMFTFYYLSENKKHVKVLCVFFFALLFAFNIFSVSMRDTPIYSDIFRFSLTTSVFSSLVSNLGISVFGFGDGTLTKSIFLSLDVVPVSSWGPRRYISYLIGMREEVTTTSTILGIPYVDFGIVGIIALGFILGLLFARGYNCLKKGRDLLPIYSLCLSFLLITIETGIGDFIVVLYFLVYALLIL